MPAEMRIRIMGGPQAEAALAARAGAVKEALGKALQQSLALVHRRITLNLTGAVLRVQTGRLRQSMQTFVEADGSRGVVGTNVEYARIHEYGGTIRPHAIPVPGKGGKLRIVQHPGATMPARPYMRPALEDSKAEIERIFTGRLRTALHGAA